MEEDGCGGGCMVGGFCVAKRRVKVGGGDEFEG